MLQFRYLLSEEVLQKLILVAHFHVLGAPALVVIEEYVELRDSVVAFVTLPVGDFRVRTDFELVIHWHAILEEFRWPSESSVLWRLIRCLSIPQG